MHDLIQGWTHFQSGKVRDLYRDANGEILLVASDRISAYDWIMPTVIPDKGAILTKLSLFWFEKLTEITSHHVISNEVPAAVKGRAIICKPLTIFPVECVVRGYLAGSGWVEYQKNSEIKTTLELANLISTVVKPGKNKHPATRSFQAIRIAINDELIMLSEALNQTIDALDKGGRLAVISFHSIEDRIVKQFIQKHSRPKQIPKGLPIMMNDTQPCLLKDLGKVKPSNEEIKINRRSRSAILRIAEKC